MSELMVEVCADDLTFEKILDLRYEVLRKPWQQSRASATDEHEGRSVNAFIKNNQGEIVACGRLQENDARTGQVRYMAVKETERGKGLGKLILEFLEKTGREKGLRVIQLQARQNAVDFYLRMNYENKGPSFILWNIIPHFLMEKHL